MLYEEDRFHPNNDDDTWIDKLPKKKDLTMFLEPIKKYECIIPCKIGYKKIQLKCYKSDSIIRNAINGIQTNDYIGTKYEDLYFKIKIPLVGMFFFDSPEEYERHFFNEVNEGTKNLWREKREIIIKLLQK